VFEAEFESSLKLCAEVEVHIDDPYVDSDDCSWAPQYLTITGVMQLRGQIYAVAAFRKVASRCGNGVQCKITLPQHFLNFLPDPQGHGSLRPTLGRRIVPSPAAPAKALRSGANAR